MNVATYIEYSLRIGRLVAPHVAAILSKGVNVVLDFPANTRSQPAWFCGIIDAADVEYELHLLDTPDDL